MELITKFGVIKGNSEEFKQLLAIKGNAPTEPTIKRSYKRRKGNKSKWTEAEDNVLKGFYVKYRKKSKMSKSGIDMLCKLMPDRTKHSICIRASKLLKGEIALKAR